MTDEQPRAYTKEETRDIFMRALRSCALYWASVENETIESRIDGLCFSILNVFDGSTSMTPSFNIAVAPHPEDKDYHTSMGENYFEENLVINDDVNLHELWYQFK